MDSHIFWGILALFLFYGFLFCVIYDVSRKTMELEKKLNGLPKNSDPGPPRGGAKESEERK
ncbi:MAG: hypothetical protein HZA37_02500 [Parcubacteria group bacterium]|nr:hypothetical protein [Parcubacteria group bacterium]